MLTFLLLIHPHHSPITSCPPPRQYIPVEEDLVIDTAAQAISLESEVGPFRFVIGGGVKGWRAASGELDFQFGKVDILLGGNKVWVESVLQLRFAH